jgi:hypothetical protein
MQPPSHCRCAGCRSSPRRHCIVFASGTSSTQGPLTLPLGRRRRLPTSAPSPDRAQPPFPGHRAWREPTQPPAPWTEREPSRTAARASSTSTSRESDAGRNVAVGRSGMDFGAGASTISFHSVKVGEIWDVLRRVTTGAVFAIRCMICAGQRIGRFASWLNGGGRSKLGQFRMYGGPCFDRPSNILVLTGEPSWANLPDEMKYPREKTECPS